MDRLAPKDLPQRPPHLPPTMYQFGGQQQRGDSYRPSNFSFQIPNGPSAPRFPVQPATSQGSRFRPRRNDHNSQSNRNRNGDNNSRPSRYPQQGGRGSWRGRTGRGRFNVQTSDRPLLLNKRAPTPEQLTGMNAGEARFKNLQDMSDSEEEEMELESDVENQAVLPSVEQERQSTHKRPRLEETKPTPKWSNPDPYFVLPPIDENAGKRKDVVKLIRKAKAASSTKTLTEAGADDFISFNFEDDDNGSNNGGEDGEASNSDDSSIVEIVDGKPVPARFSHLDRLHPDRFKPQKTTSSSSSISGPKTTRLFVRNLSYDTTVAQLQELFQIDEPANVSIPVNPRNGRSAGYGFLNVPGMDEAQAIIDKLNGVHFMDRALSIELAKDQKDDSGSTQTSKNRGELSDSTRPTKVDVWPPPEHALPPRPAPVTGGQRGKKRALDEFVEDDDSVDGDGSMSRRGRAPKKTIGINLTPAWRPVKYSNPTPWMPDVPYADEDPSSRLHQEICDIYDFLKPQKFENILREELVQRVQKCLDRNMPGAEIRFFGSFAAGLYLPEGDMDLVVFSRTFSRSGIPTLNTRYKDLRNFSNMLARERIAKPDSIVCISKAKVPIVKFVDRVTRLRVDISFENDTGVIANRTYNDWKNEYAAMPVLVTLMKQFLLMRNMNEVHTGGLGGFSVTCLVVSLMQNMSLYTNALEDPMKDLGLLLLTFLDFYGNKFDLEEHGIELNPPRYFPKKNDIRIKNLQPGQAPKLSIMDPNNNQNDVSVGSSQISNIFRAFSISHQQLRDQMDSFGSSTTKNEKSILGTLYAGNYDSFALQRAHMKSLYAAR